MMLQSRAKLLRHFGMNENLGRENHLPQQIFPPLPLINVALPLKTPWWFLSLSKQHWWRGGGEEKHFCDLVGVSIERNGEVRSLIAFVSTSFVQDCILGVGSIYIYTLLDIGLWDILRLRSGIGGIIEMFCCNYCNSIIEIQLWFYCNAKSVGHDYLVNKPPWQFRLQVRTRFSLYNSS